MEWTAFIDDYQNCWMIRTENGILRGLAKSELTKEDAKLIAAAPDLLKTLKDIIEGAEAYYENEENDAIIMDKYLIDIYKEAIQKAES